MNKSAIRFAITAAVVLAAALVAYALWNYYMHSPWTRDGRIRAEVVRVAPDVSGLVSEVRVRDNQTVQKGDVLLVIDRERYALTLQRAEANLTAAQASARAAEASTAAAEAAIESKRADLAMLHAQAKRRLGLVQSRAVSKEEGQNSVAALAAAEAGVRQAEASRNQARAMEQQALAAVDQARVAVQTAKLDLSRTEVFAPTDGYVTNLNVRVGDFASSGTATMALIDSHSFWINGYFEETKLARVQEGDEAEIRLMNSGVRIKGHVAGIARGITDANGVPGFDLLASVNPTFNWVRLAQRIPVHIAIDTEHLPAGVVLAAGMTATVIVNPKQRMDD